jgi:hypothetical protein
MKRRSLALAAAALPVAFSVRAQTRTIKFANQNANGHPVILGMERFAQLVDKNSGGRLKVNVFPGGTLGSDQANLSALQGGTLEMAAATRNMMMADGAIVEEAPPERFFTQPKDERTRQFLGQILSSHQPHHAQVQAPQPVHLPQQPTLP